jgi:U2 small nuclear ribonucleoprotein A'
MRITSDLLSQCQRSVNCLNQREINLRNYKIHMIENLGITQDEYQCIDLTDNDITTLANFPLLQRLNTLLIGYNHIHTIDTNIAVQLPNLQHLILTHNDIQDIHTLYPLRHCKQLTHLHLLHNPICTTLANYRLHIIALLPQLRVLDALKVKQAEREKAKNIRIEPTITAPLIRDTDMTTNDLSSLEAERRRLLNELTSATNLSDINRIEKELQDVVVRINEMEGGANGVVR